MEAVARIKNVSIPPRKARLVADLVRGKYVDEAIDQLIFTHKAASPIILKLIRSATANALNIEPNLDETGLYIKKITVDEGITRKWIRPRSRGIWNRELRRKSHITVIVDEVEA